MYLHPILHLYVCSRIFDLSDEGWWRNFEALGCPYQGFSLACWYWWLVLFLCAAICTSDELDDQYICFMLLFFIIELMPLLKELWKKSSLFVISGLHLASMRNEIQLQVTARPPRFLFLFHHHCLQRMMRYLSWIA